MGEAWFGLIGVVVGGFISTLWSWLSVVRQELSDAVVSARLISEELRRVSDGGPAGPQPVVALDLDLWREHRVALARGLGHRQWDAVATVYRVDAMAGRKDQRTMRLQLADAEAALEPLARGKRYVFRQRWRNALSTGKRR